jgi:hypothetical protein
MRNKKLALQIFTGGFSGDSVEFEDFKDKLLLMINNLNVDKVIIGWSLNKDLYIKTKELLRKNNIELYLWLPVFSEVGLLYDSISSKDYKGTDIKAYNLQEGENFEFYCPSNKKNVFNFYDAYEKNFSDIDFDGIFLDKIRYGSFSNGIDSIFSCFCNECIDVYKQNGLDMELLKKEIDLLKRNDKNYSNIPFNIEKYSNGKYEFNNEIWDKFFEIKGDIIFKRVSEISDYFHSKGLKVGIDTFAPFIAYFVGQDIAKLQEVVDFNKSMMYRITQAPAGLPFEVDCLVNETTTNNFNISKANYLNIIGVRDYSEKFPIEFVKKELDFLADKSNCNIYCGIEINRKVDIANVYPDYIEENLSKLDDSPIEGYVLSWDLVSAPNDNIKAVIDFLGKRGE